MQNKRGINLVSAEISGLWTAYMQDTLAICMIKYFMNLLEGEEERPILQKALDISNGHLPIIIDNFNKEGIPIPVGFRDVDVDLNAPKLFTDPFCLFYILNMTQYGMNNFTLILNQIAHPDMRDFFTNCLLESSELFNMTVDLLQQQGLYIKAPRIEFKKELDFVDSQSFFSGRWFSKKRMLIGREITVIFASLRQNIIGEALITGFAQVAKSKKVSEYLFRGRDLAWKKIDDLNKFFTNEFLPIPSTSDSFVSDSVIAPFSDKLMLSQILALCEAGIMQDGFGLSNSMRRDIQAHFAASMIGTGKYVEDGIDIMLEKGWFEQPPTAVSHEMLVKS